MKYLFIGHFSHLKNEDSVASSAAGNQVQREIFKVMYEHTNSNTQCYSMNPLPFWPRGPLIVQSKSERNIYFIGYINLPIIKHFSFSLILLFKVLLLKPLMCVQYNSYFFENLALLVYRFFNKSAILVSIIQDVNIVKNAFVISRQYLRSFSEFLALRLARRFNYTVAISEAIIFDFKFDASRCFVFQGGATNFTEELMTAKQNTIEEISVFAGSLEPYNGTDKLVNYWLSNEIGHALHIFGKGSLQPYVEQMAKITNKIIYHGHKSEEIIKHWQCKAKWNFCLRYSIGLDQKYFFPSKFFNVVCAPGGVIVNNFYGLPDPFRMELNIVKDDLSDLFDIMVNTENNTTLDKVARRRNIVQSSHSWSACIQKLFNKING